MTQTTVAPKYLTVAEVAANLRVARMTVYRLIKSGQLYAIRLNAKTIRIPTEAYDDYMAGLNSAATASRPDDSRTPGPGQLGISA